MSSSLQTVPPYKDSTNSLIYIGSTSSLSNFYQGFIYLFEIYLTNPSLNALSSLTNCTNCNICFTTEYCIPNCNISSYYSYPLTSCVNCSETCINGCRNKENCNLCDDFNCFNCTKYDPSSCLQCTADYELINQACVMCNKTSFYDILSMKCIKCRDLCTSCASLINCTDCIENAHIDANTLCECNLGYSGTDLCIRNQFNAIITLNNNNIATLIFTEALYARLQSKMITININNIAQESNLTYIDDSTYTISINFNSSINQGDILYIYLPSELNSTTNSLIYSNIINVMLFADSLNNIVNDVSALKSYAQIGMKIGLSAALGSSAITMDPISFFNFLNSAQVYLNIILFQLDLNSILVDFILSLNSNSNIPIIFTHFVDPQQGVQINGQLNVYGDVTNLLLINSGVNLTILVGLIIALPFVYFLQGFKIS